MRYKAKAAVCSDILTKKSTQSEHRVEFFNINLLTPNVNYSGRTAPLTSEVSFYIFIQQI